MGNCSLSFFNLTRFPSLDGQPEIGPGHAAGLPVNENVQLLAETHRHFIKAKIPETERAFILSAFYWRAKRELPKLKATYGVV